MSYKNHNQPPQPQQHIEPQSQSQIPSSISQSKKIKFPFGVFDQSRVLLQNQQAFTQQGRNTQNAKLKSRDGLMMQTASSINSNSLKSLMLSDFHFNSVQGGITNEKQLGFSNQALQQRSYASANAASVQAYQALRNQFNNNYMPASTTSHIILKKHEVMKQGRVNQTKSSERPERQEYTQGSLNRGMPQMQPKHYQFSKSDFKKMAVRSQQLSRLQLEQTKQTLQSSGNTNNSQHPSSVKDEKQSPHLNNPGSMLKSLFFQTNDSRENKYDDEGQQKIPDKNNQQSGKVKMPNSLAFTEQTLISSQSVRNLDSVQLQINQQRDMLKNSKQNTQMPFNQRRSINSLKSRSSANLIQAGAQKLGNHIYAQKQPRPNYQFPQQEKLSLGARKQSKSQSKPLEQLRHQKDEILQEDSRDGVTKEDEQTRKQSNFRNRKETQNKRIVKENSASSSQKSKYVSEFEPGIRFTNNIQVTSLKSPPQPKNKSYQRSINPSQKVGKTSRAQTKSPPVISKENLRLSPNRILKPIPTQPLGQNFESIKEFDWNDPNSSESRGGSQASASQNIYNDEKDSKNPTPQRKGESLEDRGQGQGQDYEEGKIQVEYVEDEKQRASSQSPGKRKQKRFLTRGCSVDSVTEHPEVNLLGKQSILSSEGVQVSSRSKRGGGKHQRPSSRNSKKSQYTPALDKKHQSLQTPQPSSLVGLFRLGGKTSGASQAPLYSPRKSKKSKDMESEARDSVGPLAEGEGAVKSNIILKTFQKAYHTLNPSQSTDTRVVRRSLKNLVIGKKAFQQRSSIGVNLMSPLMSQKTSLKPGQDLSEQLESMRIPPTIQNEILTRSRQMCVQQLNRNLSDDDEMYQDSQMFYDPNLNGGAANGSGGEKNQGNATSSINVSGQTPSFIKKQNQSDVRTFIHSPTGKRFSVNQLIANSEVMTNQIFEKVFLNDFQGLKRLNEGFATYFDRKKKFNLRDIFKRTALFYSLMHPDSYDMVEFLVTNGCDTLFLDFKGRSALHYACGILPSQKDAGSDARAGGCCDKKVVKLLIDYNKELDKFRAHTREAMEEFKERPIKNYDITPSHQDIIKLAAGGSAQGEQVGQGQGEKQGGGLALTHHDSSNQVEKTRKKANNCVSLKEFQQMGQQTNKLREYFQSKVDKELLRQQRATQVFSKEQEEQLKRVRFEKKYKKSEEYIEQLIQFVNLVDNKGMTALHYAVRSANVEVIKTLIANGANPLIRDYKLRQPVDCNLSKSEEIATLLKNARQEFEEEFLSRKKAKNRNEVQKAINLFLDNPSRISTIKFLSKRRLVIDQKNLASKNNQQLEAFMYGIYQDNVLTYLMRINDMETFDYILRRQVSPLAANNNDMNSLHVAIQLEKINFLSYLLEGDFYQYEMEGLSEEVIKQKSERLAQVLLQTDRYDKQSNQWILSSLVGLDRCSLNEGYTPLILALRSEKQQVAQYLLQILLVRERLRQDEQLSPEVRGLFAKLEDSISYFDKKQKTALLTAAKYGHLESFQDLLKMGANFFASCSKLNNALHYAVMSENEKLIKFVAWSDAENSSGFGCMHYQRNIKGMLPIDYDRKKRFYDIVYHIWDQVTILKSQTALERVANLIKNGAYQVNQQTIQGLNTPLHFAVMHENVKAIAVLLKQPGISMNIKNKEGKLPIDYAHLIPNKTTQFQICNQLQKALSVHYKSNIASPYAEQQNQKIIPHQASKFNTKGAVVKITKDDKIKEFLPPGFSSPQKKLKASNHQNTIAPSHQFTITEQGHLYQNKLKRKLQKLEEESDEEDDQENSVRILNEEAQVEQNESSTISGVNQAKEQSTSSLIHQASSNRIQKKKSQKPQDRIEEISEDDQESKEESMDQNLKIQLHESIISVEEISEINTLNTRTFVNKNVASQEQTISENQLDFPAPQRMSFGLQDGQQLNLIQSNSQKSFVSQGQAFHTQKTLSKAGSSSQQSTSQMGQFSAPNSSLALNMFTSIGQLQDADAETGKGYVYSDPNQQAMIQDQSQSNVSPITLDHHQMGKLLDAREILKVKISEYRECYREPHLLLGKFPLEIFKKWYDQYNQMYSNREIDKLTQLFNEIFQNLKDQHEKNIKLQIAMMNQFAALKEGVERTKNSENGNAYQLSKRQFNGELYLTLWQLEPFLDMVAQRLDFTPQEIVQLKQFMPLYYADTKISLTEFTRHLMPKFKTFQSSRQEYQHNTLQQKRNLASKNEVFGTLAGDNVQKIEEFYS